MRRFGQLRKTVGVAGIFFKRARIRSSRPSLCIGGDADKIRSCSRSWFWQISIRLLCFPSSRRFSRYSFSRYRIVNPALLSLFTKRFFIHAAQNGLFTVFAVCLDIFNRIGDALVYELVSADVKRRSLHINFLQQFRRQANRNNLFILLLRRKICQYFHSPLDNIVFEIV